MCAREVATDLICVDFTDTDGLLDLALLNEKLVIPGLDPIIICFGIFPLFSDLILNLLVDFCAFSK
jgi:hypothetical protein